jgi:dsRNA-specific ribonuclease
MVQFGKITDRFMRDYGDQLGDASIPLDRSPEVWFVDEEGQEAERVRDPFWNDLDESPKAVADVYEAVLGAVFVDLMDREGDFDFSVIDGVIERTLLRPWLPIAGPPSAVSIHPVKALVDYIAKTTGCCSLKISTQWNESDGSFSCRVLFHELGIGEADGSSKRHARKAASAVALGYARDNVKGLGVLCRCEGGKSVEGAGEDGDDC